MRVALKFLGGALLPLLLACGLSSPILAAWQPNGIPVAPVGPGTTQFRPNICPDGAQGVYVSWKEETATDHGNAYLQRITAAGDIATGWPERGLRFGVHPGDESICNLAPDLLGGVYTVWATNSAGEIEYRLLRTLSVGLIAPGWPTNGLVLPANPPGLRMDALCGDGGGGVYVLWTSTDFNVLMLRYSATGDVAPGWSAVGRPLVATASVKSGARVVPTIDGGFLASWMDDRDGEGPGPSHRRYAIKITPSGDPDPTWPATGVMVNTLPTAIENTFMISDGAGGAFVGWDDCRSGTPPINPLAYDIYAQHVLGNGTIDVRWPAAGLPICVAPSAQYYFEMAEDGSGGAAFVWDDYRSGAQVYATRIRPDASVAPGWTLNGAPMAPFPTAQTLPEAVGDGAGGVFGIWEEDRGVGVVIAQHFAQTGLPSPPWTMDGAVVAGGTASNRSPVATSDGRGGAIVAYRRSVVTPERINNIYVQRVFDDPSVSTRVAFLDAEVAPGTARLRWTVSDASGARAWVERRQEGEDWRNLGAPNPMGESVLAFEDRGLAPGRYAYRLGISDDGVETLTAEAWVEIPSAFTLQLTGFRPNPAVGTPSLVFTLPDDKAARLDVFDVKGRVVSSRDVGGLGAGVHTVPLAGEAWSAGMYWIRLAHPDRTLTTKGLISH
jgi:hypothetical protein